MEKIICRQTNACSTDESRGGEGEGEEGGGRREDTALTVEGRDVAQVRFTEIYCSEYY